MLLRAAGGYTCVLLSVVLMTFPRQTAAQTRASADLVVRTYNSTGVPATLIEEAQRVATLLLDDAGIGATWRRCRTKDGPMATSTDGCDDLLRPSDLAVRIVRAPKTILDPEVLGYSHVDSRLRKGFLATIFPDRVHAMAPRLQVNEGQLFGRVLAHEIGHLLLGTLTHSPTGLMRGHWFMSEPTDVWTFSPVESARMRDSLADLASDGVVAMARARTAP